jgi:hypothetical protein
VRPCLNKLKTKKIKSTELGKEEGDKSRRARQQWLPPVILATQEAEIRRIEVPSQPWANSSQDSYLEKTQHKKRAGGVAQEALSSSPSTGKKQKKRVTQVLIRETSIMVVCLLPCFWWY